MKLSDIMNESLNEGPFDLLTKNGRKQRKSFKRGQQTLKLTSDNLKNQFASYLGQNGKKDFKQATGQDLKAFLNSKDVDISLYKIPNGILQPTQLDKIIQDVSKDAIGGKGGKPIPQQNPTSIPKDLEDELKSLSTAQRQELLSKI